MITFVMPDTVSKLSAEQQEEIRQVLIKSNLLTTSGEQNSLTEENMPDMHKAALNALGIENFASLGPNFGCIAARIAETAAVAACASVPGGPSVIAACIATAHEVANAPAPASGTGS